MNLAYNKALEAMWGGLLANTLPAGAGDVRAVLIEASSYTVDPTDEFLSDIPSGARIGGPVALSGITYTDGVFNCSSPITFTAPANGHQGDAIVIFLHTGTDATSKLLLYIDSGYNLPLQTNGNDVDIQLDSGAEKLVAIESQG